MAKGVDSNGDGLITVQELESALAKVRLAAGTKAAVGEARVLMVKRG